MAMSDCPKCWDTPCTCGYEYRNFHKEGRLRQASVVLGIDVKVLTKAVGNLVPEDHPRKTEK